MRHTAGADIIWTLKSRGFTTTQNVIEQFNMREVFLSRSNEKEKGAGRFHGPRQASTHWKKARRTHSGWDLEACEPIGQISKANFRSPPPHPGRGGGIRGQGSRSGL